MKRHIFSQVLVVVLAAALAFGVSLANAAGGATPEKNINAEAKAKIVLLLKSDKLEVRATAAQMLGEMCCKDAVDLLVDMMKNDAAAGGRMVAANALAKIKDCSVIPDLREQANCDKSKTVRNVLNAIADQLEKEKNLASS
jgi:HEAT repeat protein